MQQPKNQSLRGEQSPIGAQHFNLLFKYQAGTSTPVSEHKPRHMGAPQYRLNCQEADIWAQTPASFRLRRLHLLGSNARIYIAQECTTVGIKCLHLPYARAQPRNVRSKKV